MARHQVSGGRGILASLGLTSWVTADCGTQVPAGNNDSGTGAEVTCELCSGKPAGVSSNRRYDHPFW